MKASFVPVEENAVAKFWHDKAIGLAHIWKLAASEVCFQRALQAHDRPDYRANYANCLRRMWRLDDAMREGMRALRDAPDNLEIQGTIGTFLMDKGNMKKAMEMLEKPKEKSGFFHFCYALALLHDGQWERGFKAYDARLDKMAPVYRIQPWQGEDLTGKVLAIHHEQGFGDTLMCSRFIDLLPEGIDYLFGLPSHLVRLFRHKYGERAVSAHSQLVADYAVPLMSLPARLGIKTPEAQPYIKAPSRYVVPRPPMTRLAVGLIWQSKSGGRDLSPEEETHAGRKSIPLEMLLPLAGISGVSLFGLQTGEACKDIDKLVAGDVIQDIGWMSMDFADLAGFMDEMDLIVSIDSAPAHLAGAMGKPTIVLLNKNGSWQWQGGRHTAWYGKHVETIRQTTAFDWKPVAKRLYERVKEMVP